MRFGDSFTDDHFAGETLDYLIANPPFGVDWKKQQKEILHEHDKRGFAGRFGAGLPRVNDGSLRFLLAAREDSTRAASGRHRLGDRRALLG